MVKAAERGGQTRMNGIETLNGSSVVPRKPAMLQAPISFSAKVEP